MAAGGGNESGLAVQAEHGELLPAAPKLALQGKQLFTIRAAANMPALLHRSIMGMRVSSLVGNTCPPH
jgi:hypothetical protein